MDKVKILLVASEFAPGMIPFAATVINTLAQDVRFDVRCVCVNSLKHSYEGLICDKASPLFVDYPQRKLVKMVYKLWPKKIIAAIDYVRQTFSPDVVHLLTGDFTLALYILLNKNDKFYYTVHDLHPHGEKPNSVLGKLIRKDIVWGYQQCRESINNLTTSSLSQLEELQRMYPHKKCMFTNFPTLVTPTIKNGTKVPEELVKEDGYILFFGAVGVYKGVGLLMEAYNQSSLAASHTKLVIAGKGILYESHNPNIIRLNRFIEDEEVAMLFKKAKIVVYPYLSATMSGVLSLAYFFHKLVLASDIPFFKDNMIEGVTLFQAGNAEDLRLRLEEMVKDLNKYPIDSHGYERLYSTNPLADSYWKLYSR